ncbi:MAG: sigma-70 family RNA polymerase sigma factor [Acidobacteriota bacterium]
MQTMDRTGQITHLLRAYGDGQDDAFDRVVPLLYDDLRSVARGQLRRGRPGGTMNTTGLVHELYLKLVNQDGAGWNDRQHFLAAAARAMRHLLIDYARTRGRDKRGGDRQRVDLDAGAGDLAIEAQADLLIALDRALERLAAQDPRCVQVFECRYFAGFTEEETAGALGTSVSTVQRSWRRARKWLKQELRGEEGASP